jgi:hypothetical protein
MGVCSVLYDGDVLALCPTRFLQENLICRDIAMNYFGSIDNIVILREVGLKDFGSFDYVMVKHRPMSTKIEDFVVLEVQGYQTTQTGKLVDALKDFTRDPATFKEFYNFNLNSYDIVKRTLIQMLHKGKVMESWKQKIYWVMQDRLYQEFISRYNLEPFKFSINHSTRFAIYDLISDHYEYKLELQSIVSTSIDTIFKAFRDEANVPDKEEFVKKLSLKIEQKLFSRLNQNERSI